jgi:uncharacterized protein YjbI with pentapeptide repeats
MKFSHILAGIVLAVVLLISPVSAQAASSSTVTLSGGDEIPSDLSGRDLVRAEFTNLELENTNFSDANLRGAVFNGMILDGVNLHSIDFRQGIAYLVSFKNVDLTDARLEDAMMLRSTFKNVDITGADFSGAILDMIEVQKLCKNASGVNSKTGVETRASLECK